VFGLAIVQHGWQARRMTDSDHTVQPIVDGPGFRFYPPDSTGNNKIEILGYPTAAKLVRVPEEIGKRLADLLLHGSDLRTACAFLDEFDRLCPDEAEAAPTIVCRALWHAALNAMMKCFGSSNARQRLNPDDIFGGSGSQREAFDWLRHLRNKNVAHDDNDWMQANPLAVVEQPGSDPKVSEVICQIWRFETTGANNAANLRMVANKSLEWVNNEFEQEHQSVLSELRSRDYESLLALPELSASVPTNESIGRTRS
jgi:hypothetical protein